MSSQPFLRAVSDFVMDISGLVNIRPTPGTTDNSGIRFYRENGSYVGLTADKGGKGDIMYSFPSVGSAGEVLSIKSGGELNWVSAQSGQKGDTGAQGPDGNFGGATFDYTYSTTTTAGDPGRGNIRLNNSTQTSAITSYLSVLDDSGNDIKAFLETIDSVTSTIKGYMRISYRLDSTQFILFQITDLTANPGVANPTHYSITISEQSSSASSPFKDEEDIIISFITNGNQGDKGDKGDKGEAGTNGDKGDKGEAGTNGAKGEIGVKGDQGEIGAKGEVGPDGTKGEIGAKGDQGEIGAKGEVGT